MNTQPDNLRKNALGHFVPESLIARSTCCAMTW